MPSRNVRDWIRSNDFFSGRVTSKSDGLYVPYENRYPHIHVGDNFVVYSKSKHNHIYLIQGSMVFGARAQQAYDDCRDAEMMQICRFILSQHTE